MVGFKIRNRNERVGIGIGVNGSPYSKEMFAAYDHLQEWEVEHIIRFFAYIRDVSVEELLKSLPEFSVGFLMKSDAEFYEWIRDNPICKNLDCPLSQHGEEILTTASTYDIWCLRRKDKFKKGDSVICVDEYSHLRGLYGTITEVDPVDPEILRGLEPWEDPKEAVWDYCVHWKGTSVEGEEIDKECYAFREELDFPY